MMPNIKKGLLAGIGVMLLTKDMIEDTVEKWVKASELSDSEARQIVDELMKKGEAQWKEMEQAIQSAYQRGLDSVDIENHNDFRLLKEKVDRLERRVLQLETSHPSQKNP
jgi:polyhydroxyalkanoate synthesis regulator phasin